MTVFAALERELASREMGGDARAASAKRRVRGACPIGYRYVDAIDGRTVAVNPTECDTVKSLFDMYLAMGSLDKLRRMCDLRGWRTRRGGKFTRGALYAILTNPFYAGQRATANGKRVPGDHPALVTPVVFGRVQAALARNARNPGIRGNDPNARRLRVTHGRARARLE